MRQRSGGRARDGVRKACGAALRNHYAVRAGSERGSNDGTQVVRVFDTIEQHDQANLAARLIGAGKNISKACRSASGSNRDDPLMIFRIRQTVELAAVLEAHGNAQLARE